MRWIKITALITIFVVCLILARDSQSQFLTNSLQSIDPKQWHIDKKTLLGYSSRIVAPQQNPYPFCFSASAAALFDQYRCQTQKQNCSVFKTSSFLRSTGAGQRLPDNRLDVDNGGNASMSLEHLVLDGYVEHKTCNYNHLDDNSPNYNEQARQMLQQYEVAKNFERQWNTHKNYAPYLERFYRSQWNKTLQKINPTLTEEQTQNLLGRTENKQHLMHGVLLTESCNTNIKKESKIKIYSKVPDNTKESKDLIESLLKRGIPVLANFCLLGRTETGCVGDNKHAVVIIAQTKATHFVTGDKRTAYWVINTWGEIWQSKNSDGWIFANSFLEGIFAELIWLDKK